MTSLQSVLVLLQKGRDSENDICAVLNDKLQRASSSNIIYNWQDFIDNDGWTLLHWSTQNRFLKLSVLLLDNGHSLYSQDNMGLTPLMLASYNGDIALVEVLTGVKPGAGGACSTQWLLENERYPKLPKLREQHLLEKKQLEVDYYKAGAVLDDPELIALSPNSRRLKYPAEDCGSGTGPGSPKERAKVSTDPLEISRNLLLHVKPKSRDTVPVPNVNKTNSGGAAPGGKGLGGPGSAVTGSTALSNMSLNPNSNINSNEIIPIKRSQIEERRYELLTLTNNYGCSALNYAVLRNNFKIARALSMLCPELLKMTDRHGDTVLHHAVRGGNAATVGILVNLKADVCLRNTVFELPLDLAIKADKSNTEIIKLLEKQHERRIPQLLSKSEVRSTVSSLLRQETIRAYNKRLHKQAVANGMV